MSLDNTYGTGSAYGDTPGLASTYGTTPVTPGDTGLAMSDVIARVIPPILLTDLAVAFSDSLGRIVPKALGDTGLTITDSPHTPHVIHNIVDTGVTITDEASTATMRMAFDLYADGTTTTFGTYSQYNLLLSMFADGFEPWTAPVEIEGWYAKLPFHEAEDVLGATSPMPGTLRRAKCSWHGLQVDPERGAFVLVQAGGRFDDLIGERVKLTTGRGVKTRTVFGYCSGVADIAEDLTVPRNLFLRLGTLGVDWLSVDVETLK